MCYRLLIESGHLRLYDMNRLSLVNRIFKMVIDEVNMNSLLCSKKIILSELIKHACRFCDKISSGNESNMSDVCGSCYNAVYVRSGEYEIC